MANPGWLYVYNSVPSMVDGNVLRGKVEDMTAAAAGGQRSQLFSAFFKSVHFDAGDHKAGGLPLTRELLKKFISNYHHSPQINTQAQKLNVFKVPSFLYSCFVNKLEQT